MNESNKKRSEITQIINQFINENKKGEGKMDSKIDKFLMKALIITRKFIKKNNKEVYITNSDKGNSTVIMYERVYLEKMETLLVDTETYTSLEEDPTKKCENKNNRLVKELYEKKHIHEKTYKDMKIDTAIAPRICIWKSESS